MQRLISAGIMCLFGLVAAPPVAIAAFHLYDVKEVFSNSDGTVQYVELFTTFNNQHFLTGHTIVASQDASTHTFTFLASGPSPTASTHLLIATAGFEAACGVTPDFIMADDFLFDPDGSVNFAEGTDVVGYTSLPLDGETSLNYPGEVSATNSPTNFAGATCTLEAPPPEVPSLAPWGLGLLVVSVAAAGLFQRKRATTTA
jgi:serralysin